jgi:Uma2 family endonuclease
MVAAREEGGDEMVVAAEPLHRLVLPSRDGGWTVDDFDEVEGLRIELVDGRVEVSPRPRIRHSVLQTELVVMLRPQLPPGCEVLIEPGMRWSPENERVPDVAVVRLAEPDGAFVRPEEVLLAVEVESESSRTTDRVTKPAQYASLGIPAFWRMEYEPEVVLHAYELRDGGYVEAATGVAGDVVELALPFAVSIEIANLCR